jgi:uncharacterized protein involved in exopolysaccharide biosynthesis
MLLKAGSPMTNLASHDEVSDNDPSFTELILHAYHERRMAFTTIGAILSFAMLIAAVVPPSYRATASVTVLPAPEYTVRQEAGSTGLNNNALAMDQIMEAESEILDSDDLHEAALQKAGPGSVYEELAPNFEPGLLRRLLRPVVHALLLPWVPVPADHRAAVLARALRRFRSHLTILPSKDGNVISATFSHSDPQVAARVINALIEAYAEHRSRIYDDPQLATVRAQAETGSRSVAAAERALADFKSTHDISDAATQRTLLLHRRSDAEQSAADAGAAARESKARVDSLAAQLRSEPVNVGLFQEHDPDTRVQTCPPKSPAANSSWPNSPATLQPRSYAPAGTLTSTSFVSMRRMPHPISRQRSRGVMRRSPKWRASARHSPASTPMRSNSLSSQDGSRWKPARWQRRARCWRAER